MAIKEGQSKSKLANINSLYICTCCGIEKKNREFFINRSYMYGARIRVTVCRDCMEDMYKIFLDEYKDEDNAVQLALYKLCRHFDYAYYESLFEGTLQQASESGSEFLFIYLQKITSLSQYKYKRFVDSDELPKKKGNSAKDEVESEFQLTKEMVVRWGKDLLDEDYLQLETFFQKMVDTYGCEDPIKENTLRSISKVQLEADKTLASGNIKDYGTLYKAISTMMKDGGVTPSKLHNDNDEKAMFGAMIKMVEEEEPIPEPLDIFKDVDKLGHYIQTLFVQHFSRVFGLTNENDVDYDRPYEKSSDTE